MSKNRKNNHILEIYSKFSDKELLTLINEKSDEYNQLLASEEAAKTILAKHNLYLYDTNESFKKNYFALIKCAELRGLNIPYKEEKFEPNLADIVKILQDNLTEEINYIYEYYYQFEGYCGDGIWNRQGLTYKNGTSGADIRRTEMCRLYGRIIAEATRKYEKIKKMTKLKR